MPPIKQQLHHLCLTYITERMATSQQAIEAAQRSANEETKSSAGDKYETGRAMAQLEIEKNTTQLAEALRLKQKLEVLAEKNRTETVQSGSLVMTDQGNYYLTIPAGQWVINSKTYFAISVDSPIGMKLLGLKEGSSFTFRAKNYQITKIL